MPRSSIILVLNGGSSSIKFSLFTSDASRCLGHGAITDVGANAKMVAKGEVFEDSEHDHPERINNCRTTSDAVHVMVEWLEKHLPPDAIVAVGHRVVHGGEFPRPIRITPESLDKLRALIPLAPLHQPYNLEAIEMMAKLHPNVPQVACFDTAFHSTVPALHSRFALPRVWHDKGVRRYGFHGLSYEYISGRLRELSTRAFGGRTIVAHLGSGSSLCALKVGRSFDTSMGFSALDGLVMGTRTGTIDAGVILYLLREAKLDVTALEKLLYKESGLLGVSGISADMATLLASPEPAAKEAVDLYCHRVARESGALISLLGGIDAFVFTGGIGEHSAVIRKQIMAKLRWAGFDLDDGRNVAADGHQPELISTDTSTAEIRVIPTDEEVVIARQTKVAVG